MLSPPGGRRVRKAHTKPGPQAPAKTNARPGGLRPPGLALCALRAPAAPPGAPGSANKAAITG